MACTYTYQGKTYSAAEFDDVLRAMSPIVAAEFMPGVTAVPDAPMIGDTRAWVALGIKRAIIQAAESGVDGVVFATGQQNADLYDLSKQVDSISWYKNPDDGTYSLDVYKSDKIVTAPSKLDANGIAGIVGKDIADRITSADADSGELSGLDLKVGGEGMRQFYDTIVPSVANDVLKKLGGGKVEQVAMNGPATAVKMPHGWVMQDADGNQVAGPKSSQAAVEALYQAEFKGTQPGFLIPESLKAKVQTEGLPMFQRGLTPAESVKRVVRVQAIVNGIKAKWRNAPEIIVIADMQDAKVPQRVRDKDAEMKSNGAKGEPRGFISAGKVYIVAGQHKSVADVITTVAHEVLGHGGLRGLYREALTPILRQIVTMRRAEVIAKAREYGLVRKDSDGKPVVDVKKATDAQVWAAMDEKHKLVAAEEVLANFAQTQPEMGFVKRAIAAIRNWLRENGLSLMLTDADIVAKYILPARAYIENGAKPVGLGQSLQAAFSREIGDDSAFSRTTVDDAMSKLGNQAAWTAPENTGFDDLIYKLQNKQVDMKRVIEAVQKAGTKLADKWNAYLQEELFHGRAAKRTLDFVGLELNPLLEDAKQRGLTLDEIDQYLHARHAEEANNLIAERDPKMRDGGSGMKTADAKAYLAALPADKARNLAAVAAKVDTMIADTRQLYADYEIESQDVVDEWGKMFKHYVPLMREDKDGGMGIGQGISIKGREVKHRTGSTAAVVDILANIALQREKVIVRGEKNRVAVSLAGLAKLNPNPDFWKFDTVPTERALNERTGLVEMRPDPMFKSRDNVVVAKIKGKDGKVIERAIVFNENNERAMRMALSLKNMDVAQLEGVLGVSAKITRYIASVNTQYNPVFGFVNLTRDVQGAMLNLSNTPIKHKKAEIFQNTFAALAGIYRDARAERRGEQGVGKWADLWDEFTMEGGQTGYRDLFSSSTDRANKIRHALEPTAWMDSKLGKIFTANGMLKVPLAEAQKGAGWIFDWLSDFNLALENGVRLAAYKAGIESGMSKQQAASLGKNLTVNFNRKGSTAQQAGALYAFFNASMQGTARIAETMTTMEPGQIKTLRLSGMGKKIVSGGILLGAMQAVMLAAMGFDDDEPPEFIRERNIIIPTGGKDYITIPMPLGFHFIPNIGRVLTEITLDGGEDAGKRIFGLFGIVVEAFNPLGGTMSLQTIAPTAIDPFVALGTNTDWTGKPIYRENFSNLAPTPGHTRTKDTASSWAKFIAESINTITGGTDYTPGAASPTADEIDYLFAQVTGGVGRELGKLEQSLTALATGEELPTYKVPLLGRYYGSSEGQAAQASKFYTNLKQANKHEAEIKGRRKDGLPVAEYIAEHPGAMMLVKIGNDSERYVSNLRKLKREMVKRDAPREKVEELDARITAIMTRFNEHSERLNQ